MDSSLFFVILIQFIIFLLITINVNNKKNKIIKENHIVEEDYQYRIDNVEQLKECLPNAKIKELKKQLYDTFYKIQIAKTKFDYDTLRSLCTDELYNMYKTQLQVMDMKAHKHVMDDFKLLDIRIYGASEVNGLIQLDVYLKVFFLDYVQNLNRKRIVKGHRNNYVTNRYIMSFVRRTNNTDNQKCPDCGAVVKSHSTICEYCRGKIVTNSNEFVLSKKIKFATVNQLKNVEFGGE